MGKGVAIATQKYRPQPPPPSTSDVPPLSLTFFFIFKTDSYLFGTYNNYLQGAYLRFQLFSNYICLFVFLFYNY